MMIPASRPTITENEIPSQLSICNTYSIPNVQIAISTELTLTPMPSAPSNCFIVAPLSSARGKYRSPTTGCPPPRSTSEPARPASAYRCSRRRLRPVRPSRESSRSNFRTGRRPPATSPTLSPTLSAIVAGLRGSSSGIPASTFTDQVGAHVGRFGINTSPRGRTALASKPPSRTSAWSS